jgi:hypothetical protein
MGLKQDDEKERKTTKEGVETSGQASKPIGDSNDDLGYLGESLDDKILLCDWNNHVMTLESRYKDTTTLRLVIR